MSLGSPLTPARAIDKVVMADRGSPSRSACREDGGVGLRKNPLLSSGVLQLGEPTAKRDGVWEYAEPLGAGFHSFRHVRVIRFDESGRVGTAAMEQRGVGCIIVEPRRR